MNTSDQRQNYKPENISLTRFIAFGLAIIGLFSLFYYYYSYSGVLRHIVGLEEAFGTASTYLAIGVVLSVIAIYVRRRKKNVLTRIFVATAALLVIGALLSFYTFFFDHVGVASDIAHVIFPGSGWDSAAGFFIPIFVLYFVIFGLSWLISRWLLPVYRHLSQGKVIHSLLAAFLAIALSPFFIFLTLSISNYLG